MGYPVRPIVCDILVVGGSAAALIAALEARKSGQNVLMVSKGLIGCGGNSIVSGAGFAAILPEANGIDSCERFRADTLASGQNLNLENLLTVFVEHSGTAILDLAQHGVVFSKTDGDYLRRQPPGHSLPRQIPTVFEPEYYHTRGLSITLPLRDAARRCGIRFLEKTPIVELLQDADGICGAVGINVATSEYTQISSNAVILATGGAGTIYARTNNTSDVTGDGYGLALDAGAKLIDMEFVQFYPTMAFRPIKIPVSSPMFGDGAVLRNKNLERFLSRYDPAGDMATRDSMSRAIFSEVNVGNGVENGVYIDCSGIPDDIFFSRYKGFANYLLAHGIDPQKDMLLISPTAHFFMGGIFVDENCSTGVAGLFASGEVVGGLHGANRLSGNALTEAAVFGKIAGQMAARHAAKFSSVRRVAVIFDERQHDCKKDDLNEIKSALRQTMWENVSLMRSRETLEYALSQITQYQNELIDHATSSIRQLAEKNSLERMLTTAEAVVRSALLRTESRGCHFRCDYPTSNHSDWIGHVEVKQKKRALNLKFKLKE